MASRKSQTQSEGNGASQGRFTTELLIEGVFLHIRAIIEQGRTEEFLRESKERGFNSLKGQSGIVEFTRQFIERGEVGRELLEITAPVAGNRFAEAVLRKPKIDHC